MFKKIHTTNNFLLFFNAVYMISLQIRLVKYNTTPILIE